MASPATATQRELPEELLEDIFLRLDDAADLARASAACTSFRRVVSDRRFQSLHPPPVLGILDSSTNNRGFLTDTDIRFYQAQPPRRAVARSGDFTFSFLADPKRWHFCDTRDGRILLGKHTPSSWDVFDNFVLYDPLHGRHVEIPSVPGDLVAATANCVPRYMDAFLGPPAENEKETSVQVMCNVISEQQCKIATFTYSSVTEKWQWITSYTSEMSKWIQPPALLRRCHGRSCFFWTRTMNIRKTMLVLDTCERKFSVIDLPLQSLREDKIIVEAEKGKLGLFILNFKDSSMDLYTMALQDNGAGAKDWHYEKTIRLPKGYYWAIHNAPAPEGYILLQGVSRDQYSDLEVPKKEPDVHYFTMEVKTLVVEQLCVTKFKTGPKYLYASFPPPLSLPRI